MTPLMVAIVSMWLILKHIDKKNISLGTHKNGGDGKFGETFAYEECV